ncbi:MAG TPA: BolA family protein [Rhizomicrobium sp.]|jgi:BolA protein|nr:BolA family protein [Rhizomicrobium sp.]
MSIADEIQRKLSQGLAPTELYIEDESAHHAGHSGARPEGETHFRVRVVSTVFESMGRLARQRLIHELLSEELRVHVHALSIEARTPNEAGSTRS